MGPAKLCKSLSQTGKRQVFHSVRKYDHPILYQGVQYGLDLGTLIWARLHFQFYYHETGKKNTPE